MMQNRFSEQVSWLGDRSSDAVGEHPMSSAILAFGIGFGLGIVLGASMLEAPRQQTYAERLGQQMLDAMARVLPESVISRVG